MKTMVECGVPVATIVATHARGLPVHHPIPEKNGVRDVAWVPPRCLPVDHLPLLWRPYSSAAAAPSLFQGVTLCPRCEGKGGRGEIPWRPGPGACFGRAYRGEREREREEITITRVRSEAVLFSCLTIFSSSHRRQHSCIPCGGRAWWCWWTC